MTHWNPPPGFMPIAEAAAAAGTTVGCLRIWEDRYEWPTCIRNPINQYRYYAPLTVADLRRFVAAGSPFHEIRDGAWSRHTTSTRERPPAIALDGHTEHVEPVLVAAAQRGDRGIVALYLASLGRMRPQERAATIACVRCASAQLDGKFDDLVEQYAQSDAIRTLHRNDKR